MLFKQQGNSSDFVTKIIDLGYAQNITESEQDCDYRFKPYTINWIEQHWNIGEFNSFAGDWAYAEKMITRCYREFDDKNFNVKTLQAKLERASKNSDPKICEYGKEDPSETEKMNDE